jgi:type III secretory pathway lipoprotein EscJ
MRTVAAVLSLLFIFTLCACDEKTSFEHQAEKDANARRAINTGEK